MSFVTEAGVGSDTGVSNFVSSLIAGVPAAAVAGAGLALAGRQSAVMLLVAVAVVQALFALAWVFGSGMPGRRGGLVVATLAAAGADTAASVWPHDRLGTLLAVLGLAVPVMFVHQLMRGAARVQVVASLSAVGLLVLTEVSLAALLQLRHEFPQGDVGGRVVAAVVAAAAGALVVGYLVDLVLPAPRFDQEVPRGLLAVLGSVAVGGAVGYLLLKTQHEFAHGRAVFVGAALGAMTGLLAVAAAFVLHTTPRPASAVGRGSRPVVAALLPLCLTAPAAFLLCLAVRT